MRYSVITINYNNREGLRHTIESVVGQVCNDYEYIVIDGGSNDGSVEVIRAFESQISFWLSEDDSGIYNAMNKGVSHAHGDYCIFINSGDVFYDDTALQRIMELDCDKDVIVGKVTIDDRNTIISPPPGGELTLYHLYSGAIPHQGSFIRTELLRKYPYDEELKISSDWKFFVQVLILDNCSVSFVDEYVARYDLNGLSSRNPELMRKEKDDYLKSIFPPRLLEDYFRFKQSECLTQSLTPSLRRNYRIDKVLYAIGVFLLKMRSL